MGHTLLALYIYVYISLIYEYFGLLNMFIHFSCVFRKESSSDLLSRYKTRKILGVGESSGNVNASKVKQNFINVYAYIYIYINLFIYLHKYFKDNYGLNHTITKKTSIISFINSIFNGI
ncbi:unnamed protein product [Trichobilharzia regenti]|nr:unnamed protein product [Trichobilharzia regenti]